MEKSEPSLVPEWLKSSSTSTTGSGNSNHQFTSSALHSDNHSALRHARNKLSCGIDHEIEKTSVSERTTSGYFRRSSSSNGSSRSRSYSSFTKGHRDRDRQKDVNGYHDTDKSFSDRRNRNYTDSLDDTLPSLFEKDLLRRSQSMITGKRGDTWPRRVMSDSSSTSESNNSSRNGLFTGVSTAAGDKSAFERDFPVLSAEERQVGSEVGRVSSPGLSTSVQSLPVGTSAVTGSDSWTSALADMPLGVGSSGTGVAVVSQNVSASSVSMAPAATTGLNMAEALAQGPSRARTPPLLNAGTQRQEELAIKQSRQLIPLVTTSMPKTLVVNSSEKLKPKVGQQQHPSHPLNHMRSGTLRSDNLKVSNESRLQILKPSRELNGILLSTKDNLSPTNVSNKSLNSPQSVTPTVATSVPFRSSGNSPSFATAERIQTPFRITIEKRPTAQAQSRNDFFNLLKKKSTTNSPPSVPCPGTSLSPSGSEKSDELGMEDSSASVAQPGETVSSSEISTADLPTDNRSEMTQNGDAFAGSNQCSSNGHSSPNAFTNPDEEEEVAFLRSLGWDENAGDDEGLTEDEISAFLEKYAKVEPTSKLFQRMQLVVPLNSHNGTHDGAKDSN